MGVPWLQLIDHDSVESVNLAPQGFLELDIESTKVKATADLCEMVNSQMEIHQVPARFRRSEPIGHVLFNCVDSIDTRRRIWEAVEQSVEFYTDGRMSAEVIRVLTAADAPSRAHYPTTLFSSGDAFTGSCTARSTIFTANIAAGLMLEQFSKWLRRLPVDYDLQFNLLSSELTCIP
jgi:sulfur carrier protein ThiS adenylyltransferase